MGKEPDAAGRHPHPALTAFLGYDPTPQPQTIGECIRAKRRALGLTIRQAAKELNTDPTALWNWEGGGTSVRRTHRKTIAAFIGMDEETLDREMRRAWNDAQGQAEGKSVPAPK